MNPYFVTLTARFRRRLSCLARLPDRRAFVASVRRGLRRGLTIGAILSGILAALVVVASIVFWLSARPGGRGPGPLGLAAYLFLYRGSGVGVLLALIFYSGLLGALAGGIRAVSRDWRRDRA